MNSSLESPIATIFAGTGGIIAFVFALLVVIAMWALFNKAGHSGIKSIIPLYNLYTLFKIAWGNGWIFLLLFLPFINIIIQIIFCLKLAKAFGKGTGFGIGLILLYPLFILMLGFGQAQYLGPAK